MKKLYTGDFETTTGELDCRIWAWGLCEIDNPEVFIYGNCFDSLWERIMSDNDNYIIYFHNLKFDGEFWFYYLLKHDFTCVKEKKDIKEKTFRCLISDVGLFFTIEIYITLKKKIILYDSLKILNFSVADVAKSFGLSMSKGELDYRSYRAPGHNLTNKEIDYLKRDVTIMAQALNILFKEKLNSMTMASNSIKYYKKTINFKRYFPILGFEIDEKLRRSYKGGWTYLNPLYSEKRVKKGIVIDKNSMYPSHMYNDYFPYDHPIYYEGEYKKDLLYPLFIQKLSCSFKLKKGKLPTIQLKGNCRFLPNEYIETTEDEIVTFTLTNVDLDLFFENYEIDNLVYHDGYKFKQIKGIFCKYIDDWMKRKNDSKKEGNKGMYTISKLMLNSLYGKFGLNPNIRGKYPYLKEDESIGYKLYDKEIKDSIYVPVASFITAYSRADIIRSSQKIRDYSINKYGIDYYIYSDTDSIHCLYLEPEELSNILDIDDYQLGAWKIETIFKEALFIRQKCYIEKREDNTLNTTIAGLPKKLGKYLTLDNFKKGFTISAIEKDKEHKLRFKHVKGGIVLVDTDFTIK